LIINTTANVVENILLQSFGHLLVPLSTLKAHCGIYDQTSSQVYRLPKKTRFFKIIFRIFADGILNKII